MRRDYETLKANAQGRDLAIASEPFPLICMDVSVTKDGFSVADVSIRNVTQDDYGVGFDFQIQQGKSWRNAKLSWVNMGAEEGYCTIYDGSLGSLQARIYCHSSFREQNLDEIRKRFATVLAARISDMELIASHVEERVPLSSRPKP